MTPSLVNAAPRTGTLAMEISRPEIGHSEESSDRQFFERLLVAVEGRREVGAVAAASYVPPTRPLGNVRFSIEGRAISTEAQTALASAVSAAAFRLLGITLVRGRLIEERDGPEALYVAVISGTLARKYWTNENPIGHRIVLVGIDKPITVVGIVGDVRQPLSKDPRAESVLYLSYQQIPWPFMTLIVSPAAEPGAAVAAVRQEVARIDGSQAVGAVHPLDELRTEWLGQPRLQSTVVTVFGAATLLLTLVGLYARVAHGVVARSRECAIRLALGASPTAVIRPVTGDMLIVGSAGIFIELAVLPLITPVLRRLVVDASAVDFGLTPVVACLVGLGGVVTAYWPARRAARIDAARFLRDDE
jgi:putative ABC transport system permease protein